MPRQTLQCLRWPVPYYAPYREPSCRLLSSLSMSFQIPRDLPNLSWRSEISWWSGSWSSRRGVMYLCRLFSPPGLLASGRPRAYLYTRGFPQPKGDSSAFRYAAPEGRGSASPCTPLGGERGGPLVRLWCILSLYPGARGPMYQQQR